MLLRLCAVFACCLIALSPSVLVAEKPNIVVILADDFGVGDIQAHYPKNKIATPHLDRLVRQGISFTDAHSPSAVCSPTRYGLLTGRYAWRTRLREWVIAAYEPPLIAADRITLPGFLREQGYHTSCVGKWHLGWEWPGPQPSRMTDVRNGQKDLKWDFTQPIKGGPIDRGFDDYFGVDLPNIPPFTWIRDNRVAVQPTEKWVNDLTVRDYMPRAFAGCPTAPGWKLDAILPEITQEAVRKVHELAKRKKPFFLYFSQTSPHEPVSPSPRFKGKSGIAPIADFVMETDWSAGQVIKAVDDAGIADNTIVIFTADNGHSHYTGWPELVAAGHMPSGPFRGHKGDIWEGGHRVPLVIRWPKHIEAHSSSDRLVSLTDIFATCADVVKGTMPRSGAEDSISFLPAALGKSGQLARPPIINHSNHGEFALRDNDWKLVFRNRGALNKVRGQKRIVELYNLKSDVAEEKNLAATHGDTVKRLTAKLDALVNSGATRKVPAASNDSVVRYSVTQPKRWVETPWIIDPHTHFKGQEQIEFERKHVKRDPRNTLGHVIVPEDYRSIADRLGIQSTLVVEAVDQDQPQFNDWLLREAKSDLVCGYVARGDLTSKSFTGRYNRYRKTGYLKGYRFRFDELNGYLKNEIARRHLKTLARDGMVVDLLVEATHAGDVVQLAKEFPQLKIVINHCFRAKLKNREMSDAWKAAVKDCARFPNVYCKISSILNFTESKPFDERAPSNLATYRPILEPCFEAFGEDRVIFATNWGVSAHFGPIDDVVQIVKEFLRSKGESALRKGMRENAIRVYGITSGHLR